MRRARFVYPDGSVHYHRVRIGRSTVIEAGMGAFTTCFIPKGAYAVYRGRTRSYDSAVMHYSWNLYEHDPETGEANDRVIGYIDAHEKGRTSNFTRYVNCGPRSNDNNVVHRQCFSQIRYVLLRDVQEGEELFIDYGEEYRTISLGMTGEY